MNRLTEQAGASELGVMMMMTVVITVVMMLCAQVSLPHPWADYPEQGLGELGGDDDDDGDDDHDDDDGSDDSGDDAVCAGQPAPSMG